MARRFAVFFDLGDTLGEALLEGEPPGLFAFAPFPYIAPILERLRQAGHRLGIISNTGADVGSHVDLILENAGLLEFFAAELRLYSADLVGLEPKPEPDMFREAVARLAAGEEAVFVGEDARERAAAKTVGLKPVPHPALVEDVLRPQPGGDGERLGHLYYAQLAPPRTPAAPGGSTAPEDLGVVYLLAPGAAGPSRLAVISDRALDWLSDALFDVATLGSPDLPEQTELYLLRDDDAVRTGAYASGGSTRRVAAAGPGVHRLRAQGGSYLTAIGPDVDLDRLHFANTQHGHTVKLLADPVPWSTPAAAMAWTAPAVALPDLADVPDLFIEITPEELADHVNRLSGQKPLIDGDGKLVESRHLAHDDNKRVVDALAAGLKNLGGGRLSVRRHRFSHRGLSLENIEAELLGETPELVLITAHLDSTAGNDENFVGSRDRAPGADDDASGVAAVLALARRFATLAEAAPLRRTLRFVLFNAEEEGLVGSQAYARLQRARGAPIVAVLQMDMIGYNPEPPYSWELHAGCAANPAVEVASLIYARLVHDTSGLEDGNVDRPQLYHTRLPGGDPADGRSDHSAFHANHYPALVASTDFFPGPGPQDPSPEPNPNYHSGKDRVVHPERMAPIVRTIGRAAWRLANARPASANLLGGNMPQPRELDTRGFARAAAATRWAAAAAAAEQPPRLLATTDSLLTSRAPRFEGASGVSLVDRAIAFAQREQGFAADSAANFVPDPLVQATSSGTSAVHLQQHYKGLPLFQVSRTVLFDAQGRLTDAPGQSVALPPDLDTLPRLSAEAAARRAADHIAASSTGAVVHNQFGETFPLPTVDPGQWSPEVLLRFPLPTSPTVVDKGPFEQMIPLHLVVFVQPDRPRLAWHSVLTLPGPTEKYVVIVAADRPDGEILYSKSTTNHMRGRGLVYEMSPGLGDRREVPFPRPLTDYPVMPAAPLAGFPHDWVEDGGTVGNAVRATLNNGNNTLKARIENGEAIFDPTDKDGDEQKLLNIFYFCNVMHDFLHLLGFDEASGNFQRVNFTAKGAGNDPVRARAHSGAVYGTASMSTYPDGTPPVMNMGMVTSTGRHTAFDADVVFHEFAHGLTNRLVGGPLNTMALDAPQSGAMGEGWGDYYALSIISYWFGNEKIVSGDWVLNSARGIRRAPYDTNYPFTYGKIYQNPNQAIEVHDAGEVWCAALMEMTRRLRAALGNDADGYRLAWQIVTDGLKLTPANPSFLEARDAILRALADMRAARRLAEDAYPAVLRACWEAFARFGMGANAFSPDPGWDGVIADHSLPPEA